MGEAVGLRAVGEQDIQVRGLFIRALGHNGGSPTYGHAESTRWFAQFLVDLYGPGELRDLIISQRWVTEQRLDEISHAVREWGQRPDAFFSWLYCAALGWNQPAE